MNRHPAVDIKSAFTGHEDGDPPLLSDLDIHLPSLRVQYHSIIHNHTLHTYDLVVPLLLLLIFCLSLLFTGKMMFGCVYFVSIVNTVIVHSLVNVLTDTFVDYVVVCSIMGYAMLPVVVFSVINSFMHHMQIGYFALLSGLLFSFISSFLSASMFMKHARALSRVLLQYPVFLVYLSYVILSLY